MDGSSYPRSRSSHKRSSSHYDDRGDESNNGRHGHGGHKRYHYNSSSSAYSPRARRGSSSGSTGEVAFRILCPEPLVGSIIGKGGSIVKSLRQETGARITIQDAVPGSEERVVLISSYFDTERDRDGISPAQEALFRVHARIFENGNGDDEDEDEHGRGGGSGSSMIKTRLVVPSNQVGCLLGKGGKIIEQMRDETKAQIRVLPSEHLPTCALSTDEIVQISGELSVVKKALSLISSRLKGNPPRDPPRERERERDRDRDRERDWEHGPSSPFRGHGFSPERRLPPVDTFPSHSGVFAGNAHEDGMLSGARSSGSRNLAHMSGPSGSGHMHPDAFGYQTSVYEHEITSEELVFRVLCPHNKIETVYGQNGMAVKQLEEDIGVKIKITDPVPGSDDRIIIVSAIEVPEENLSPAQEALLHIQSQIVDLGPDMDGVITTKLLIPSNQTGCLLGKGGSIISEMRRETHANIRILSKEELPPCALDTDELVLIAGDIRAARAALLEVTSRLRGYLHREMGISGPPYYAPHDPGRRRFERSSPGRSYSPGMSTPVGSHTLSNLDAGPRKELSMRSLTNYEERTAKQGGSMVSGVPPAGLVTKTTVEVVIPEYAIASLIANSAKAITQISQIAGAKINVLEVRPGAERKIEISGTPEQTSKAQNLLQSFILKLAAKEFYPDDGCCD